MVPNTGTTAMVTLNLLIPAAMNVLLSSYLQQSTCCARAQSLAKHSTIDLTMGVYTMLTIADQASAILALPKLDDVETSKRRYN